MFQLSAKTSNMDVFMGVVLMASCIAMGNAESLGPPPGSPGIIDFRYPDYIVEPLPDCPHDGFFPHPRNCSWHYRCYDRIGLGFYWRAYFECPYGTTFAPGINNCINGFENSNCKGKNGTDVLPPPDNDICGLKMLNCHDYEVCINNQLPIILHLCQTAYLECSITGIEHKCKHGMYYEPKNDRCLPNPDTLSCQELNCTQDNLRPFEDWMKTHCIAKDRCYPKEGIQYFCHDYYQCNPNNGGWSVIKISCNERMIFSYDNDSCVPLSVVSKPCDDEGGSCKVHGERPFASWMIPGCPANHSCSNPLVTAYYCSAYYECVCEGKGNCKLEKKSCGSGYLYSYTSKYCVPKESVSKPCDEAGYCKVHGERPFDPWMIPGCPETHSCSNPLVTAYYCSAYYECVCEGKGNCILKKKSCSSGYLYNYTSTYCVPKESVTDCIVNNKFKCTKDKERVINADMMESDICVKKKRCNPNLEDAFLCKHYYQCNQNYNDNLIKFKAEAKFCGNGILFNTGTKLCVSKDALNQECLY